MIRFIDTFRDRFGVEFICRVLGATACGFITSRGYRAAKSRKPAARAIRDGLLVEEVKRLHAANYGVYGVRKMWHAMRRAGWDIGRDQTARLMRVAGVTGVVRGRKPRTTVPARVPDQRPDLVMRDFKAPAPNRLWVADITYVRTSCGFVYTAFVIDAYSRRIVGWATRSSMTTEALSLEALEHALNTARGGAEQCDFVRNMAGFFRCSVAAHCREWRNRMSFAGPQGGPFAGRDSHTRATTYLKRSSATWSPRWRPYHWAC